MLDNSTANQGILLSIIIPCANLIRDFDNVMRTAIACQSSNIELILAIDSKESEAITGSIEKISNQIASSKFSVVIHDSKSPGLTRNLGIELARGEWITFWDSDDNAKVEEYVKAIAENKDKKPVIVGQFEIMNTADNIVTVPQFNTSSPKTMSIKPGIWRFIFSRERLGMQKFSHFRMGEDQLFLAELNIQDHEIMYSERHFYQYLVGSPFQLTKIPHTFTNLEEVNYSMLTICEKWSKNSSITQYLAAGMLTSLLVRTRFKNIYGALKILFTYFNGPKKWRRFVILAEVFRMKILKIA